MANMTVSSTSLLQTGDSQDSKSIYANSYFCFLSDPTALQGGQIVLPTISMASARFISKSADKSVALAGAYHSKANLKSSIIPKIVTRCH